MKKAPPRIANSRYREYNTYGNVALKPRQSEPYRTNAPKKPNIRLVNAPLPATKKSPRLLVTGCVTLILLTLFASLFLNTHTARISFEKTALETQNQKIAENNQQLVVQLQRNNSDLANRAVQLGMVQSDKSLIIKLKDKTVYGK
jgi:hypothetical protein